MCNILLQDVRNLLDLWSLGSLDARKVHEEAEKLWESIQPDSFYPKDNYKSIIIEVLSQLEILNHQLIMPDDIPAILRFLDTPNGKELQGWEDWLNYWENIDMDVRRENLRSNPYYCSVLENLR
ncbi:hypothetical protein [Anthocerotibacter panamensis]|uniref:hypothetical protein n=1 Tax=Anthocerotibacter panamensis TaxID=2857077 RepID=UPI001C402841|nr:hypothetical protein [Anthocerotibacter panamensis]